MCVLAFLFIVGLTGCASDEREFLEDVVVTLEDSSEKIIIKEWRFLLGSGAEVYYQKDSSEPVLLGKTTGGDDGFCPFNEGLYELTQDGNSVTIKWSFNPSDSKDKWRSKTFNLPVSD